MSGLMSKHMNEDAVNPRHPRAAPRKSQTEGMMPTIGVAQARSRSFGSPVVAILTLDQDQES